MRRIIPWIAAASVAATPFAYCAPLEASVNDQVLKSYATMEDGLKAVLRSGTVNAHVVDGHVSLDMLIHPYMVKGDQGPIFVCFGDASDKKPVGYDLALTKKHTPSIELHQTGAEIPVREAYRLMLEQIAVPALAQAVNKCHRNYVVRFSGLKYQEPKGPVLQIEPVITVEVYRQPRK